MENQLDRIEHIIVLMLENRSFDNMLGWLGTAEGESQKVNGVAGKGLSNPIPGYADNPDNKKSVKVGKGTVMTNPNPDPGEEYYHVNTQLFGKVNPPENRYKPFNRKPYNLLDDGAAPSEATMDGFLCDYIDNFAAMRGRTPSFDEYKIIMDCFDEQSVPVISKLAKEYAVFDSWHCSVPSQTFCNRSFVHSAMSNGYVVNSPYFNWLLNDAPTIFNRIEDKKDPALNWKVYYDKLDGFSLTGLIQPAIWKYRDSNFAYMDQFEADAASGNLPSYSFIEPRLFIDHNDEHPPIDDIFVNSSVLAGEILINRVYQAVRHGKHWDKSLLIITYDEHGGCYDHVSPPAAIPPLKGAPKGQYGFKFDRLGVRVSTVMVAPYIRKGTIMNEVYDHTSIIRTVAKRWDLDPLTERDKHARCFEDVLNLSHARTDFPVITPRPYEPPENVRDEPLNDLQKAILYIVAGREDAKRIEHDSSILEKAEDLLQLIKDEARVAHIKTVGQAIDFMTELDQKNAGHRSVKEIFQSILERIRGLFLGGKKS
jgi:phospholipase C